MNSFIHFPIRPSGPKLDGAVAEIEHKVSAQLGVDSLAAAHNVEQMRVAVSFVCEYFNRPPRQILISDVSHLDCVAVAEEIAKGAGPEGIAGVARCIRNLVQLAHSFERQTHGEKSGLWNEIARFMRRMLRNIFTAGHRLK